MGELRNAGSMCPRGELQPVELPVRFLRAIGIDRAVGYAVLGNVTSLLLGPVTALLIAWRFSPELQGFHYTFGSLISLQFLFDMGLGQALIQFASHEWSKLSLNEAGDIAGEEGARSRLLSLGRISFRWYLGAAALLLLALTPSGYHFFSQSPGGIEWTWPWLALCAGVVMNFVLIPVFSFLQGCNQVSQFWFYRWIQQIVNGLVMCSAIFFGAGLWTLPLATAAGLLWSGVFLGRRYRGFMSSFLLPSLGPRIQWRSEVWPVQWRIAISWVGAYFTTSLFAPILFRFSGPVAAGRMGLTATLAMVLLAVSSNWVVTRGPYFGVLIARGSFKELDRLFWRSLLASLVIVALGASVVTLGVYFLSYFRHPLSDRILPPLATFFLLLGTVFNSATIGLAVYLRAHKREPLAGTYLVTGILILAFALFLAGPFGAEGVTFGYLAGVACIQFPWAIRIFRRCRREWRGPLAGAIPKNVDVPSMPVYIEDPS